MPSIGDRLEEARKRQGISIREASEATKIRGDLLLCLENNNFDFDLPDVYKRGFLKLYARYLKLDIEKIMTDYDAVILGRSKVKRSDAREFFGRMDLPERTTPLGSSESTPPHGEHEADRPRRDKSDKTSPADPMEGQSDTSLYWKVGGIFIIVAVIFTLLALLVQTIFSGDPEPRDPSNPADATAGLPTVPTEITLIGKGDTYVVVNSVTTNQRIPDAPRRLQAGEEVSFLRDGPIMIAASNIENLAVRIDGQVFNASGSGVRRWYFNEDGPYTPE